MPSFTCPNNMSIITGTPASGHGISGNYYLDTATGQPVVMTGPELLRGDTCRQIWLSTVVFWTFRQCL